MHRRWAEPGASIKDAQLHSGGVDSADEKRPDSSFLYKLGAMLLFNPHAA